MHETLNTLQAQSIFPNRSYFPQFFFFALARSLDCVASLWFAIKQKSHNNNHNSNKLEWNVWLKIRCGMAWIDCRNPYPAMTLPMGSVYHCFLYCFIIHILDIYPSPPEFTYININMNTSFTVDEHLILFFSSSQSKANESHDSSQLCFIDAGYGNVLSKFNTNVHLLRSK